MKTLVAAACALWMVMAVELATAGSIARGALLLPIACGVMFWTRSTSGIVLAGFVLLIDWIARPAFLPLCPMLLPFLAVGSLAPSPHHEEFTSRRVAFKIPLPLHLPLITLVAVVLQDAGTLSVAQWSNPAASMSELATMLRSQLIFALPLSGLLSLMIRVADEFGMRRTFS